MCFIGVHLSSRVTQLAYKAVIADNLWQSLQRANICDDAYIHFLHIPTSV